MKFEVNITKKYAFIFLFSIILIAGAVFVYAVAPNPGHDAAQIGPGDFKGPYGSTWSFPGRILMLGNKGAPSTVEWASINDVGSMGARWRAIQNGAIFSIQAADEGGFGQKITPLSIDGATGKIKLIADTLLAVSGLAGQPSSLEFQAGDGFKVARISAVNNNPGPGTTGTLTIDMTPDISNDVPEVTINKGSMSFNGDLFATTITGKIYPGSLPIGSWCGWVDVNTNVKCGTTDISVACPTNFVKKTVTTITPITTCVKTA